MFFLVALMGRFSLDRLGAASEYADLDLRLLGFAVLIVLLLLRRISLRGSQPVRVRGRAERCALGLLAYLAITAFWSPAGSPISDQLVDVALVFLCIVMTATLSAADPVRARQFLLWMTAGAGIVYAFGGLLLGQTSGAQSRTVFLGGGPNIYGRVVCLGIIALIFLAARHRRLWILIVMLPIMGLAVVLSGSRGVLVAALATMILGLFMLRRRISSRAVALMVTAPVVSVAVIYFSLSAASAQLLRNRYLVELFEEDNYSSRPQLLTQALAIFEDHFVIGRGLGGFFVDYGDQSGIDYPHNLILEIAVDGGLVALIGAVLYVVFVISDCRAPGGLSNDQIALLLAGFYVFVAAMFSGDLYDSRFMWIYLTAALVRGATRTPRRGEGRYPVSVPGPPRAGKGTPGRTSARV